MDRGLDLVNFTVIFGKINPICVALGLGILFQFTIVKFRMTYHELPTTASEIQQDESDKERDTRLDIRHEMGATQVAKLECATSCY